MIKDRKLVAVETLLAVSITDHHQDFLVAFLSLVGARHHASLEHLNDQRTLRAVAHIDLGPLLLFACRPPRIDTRPRTFRMTAASKVRRRIGIQITDERVARNRQQIAFVKTVQTSAKPIRTPHFVVACNPRMRQPLAVLACIHRATLAFAFRNHPLALPNQVESLLCSFREA